MGRDEMVDGKIKQIEKKIRESCSKIKSLSDSEFKELANSGVFDKLLLSIYNPKDSKKYENLQDRLLKNKNRLSFLALLRYIISENYSFKGKVGKTPAYVSPFHSQWLDNGVVFIQGKDKWEGLIGFYDNEKDIYFAKSKRNFKGGETIDIRKDLFFDFFYQKINSDKKLNDEQKKEVIDKLEDIKDEKDPGKRKSKFEKIKKVIGKAWYLSNKAFWDSVWETLDKK